MAELDKIRTELLNRSAITLQRHARGFVKRSQYQRKRHAVITLQACVCIPGTPFLMLGLSYITHQLSQICPTAMGWSDEACRLFLGYAGASAAYAIFANAVQ